MIININPARGDLRPKKATDQNTLRVSWIANTIRALLDCEFLNPLRQTKNAATPMRAKSVIQTGAKTQLGGVKTGFLRVVYQVEIAGAVKIDPTVPASWQTTMLTMNLKMSPVLLLFIATLLKVSK